MVDRSIRWSERSLEENKKLLNYLLEEWGEEVGIRIREQIKTAVNRIHYSPEIF
jgi:plasmid stabilization system protein ParE